MLYRIILTILKKWQSFKDSFINYLELKNSHVCYTTRPIINGRIIIKNNGKIILGDSVIINNDSSNNPVGLPHPTILCTQNKDAKIVLGNRVGISGASIVAANSITIGNRVLIGGGVCIWDTDFHPLDPEQRALQSTLGAVSRPVIIEDDVFIGARAIILKGVTIGQASVIGAGCIVSKSVPPRSIVVGINDIISKV